MGTQYTRNIILFLGASFLIISISSLVYAATCSGSGYNVCGTQISCVMIKAGVYDSTWEQRCDQICGDDCNPAITGTTNTGCTSTAYANSYVDSTKYCSSGSCRYCNSGYLFSGAVNGCKPECPSASTGTINAGCPIPSPIIPNSHTDSSYQCVNPGRGCTFCDNGYVYSAGSCILNCTAATPNTIYAGCRAGTIANSHNDTTRYCASGQRCVLCNNNYQWNGSACASTLTCYYDNDNDSFGNHSRSTTALGSCPTNYVSNYNDCDDSSATIVPGYTQYFKNSCNTANGCTGSTSRTCDAFGGAWRYDNICTVRSFDNCCIGSVSVTENCAGTCCKKGEILSVSLSLSGNCSTARHSQVDYYGGSCAIRYGLVEMNGMSNSFSNPGSTLSYQYTIPTVNSCDGQTVSTVAAALRTGAPPASVISNDYPATTISNVCFESCGDGVKNGGDQCDDGNTNNNDLCNNDCTCGPGYTWNGVSCVVNSMCYYDSDNDGFGNLTRNTPGSGSTCPANYVNNSYDCNDNNNAVRRIATGPTQSCSGSNGCAGTKADSCSDGIWTVGSCIYPTYNCTGYCTSSPSGCCKISSVDLDSQSGNYVGTGDEINADIQYTGDCSLTRNIQIDFTSADNNCMIQYSGVHMPGMNVNYNGLGSNGGTYTGQEFYPIPAIPNQCRGKTLTNVAAMFRTAAPSQPHIPVTNDVYTGIVAGMTLTCPAGYSWNGNSCVIIGETCNNVDDSANSITDEGCDDDSDGYADSAMTCSGNFRTGSGAVRACASYSGDCNDNNAQVYPSRTEICNNIDDNCVSGIDENPSSICGAGNYCTAGLCKPNCNAATLNTRDAGCGGALANSYFNNSYYCASGSCRFCSPGHVWNGAACIAYTYCGDGTIQAPNSNNFNEVCDSDTKACDSGFIGTKTCKADCSGYDTSSCIPTNCDASCVTTCGNGLTCSWAQGFKCRLPACVSQPDCSCYCGDGNIDTELGENCDMGTGNNGACPASCSSSCQINSCPTATSVSITPQIGCGGNSCTNGSVLNVNVVFSGGSSTTARRVQMDFKSADSSCIIQNNGIHMQGINYTRNTGLTSPVSFTYTIPSIPANCLNKNLTRVEMILYADDAMTTPVSNTFTFNIPAITLVPASALIPPTLMRCGEVHSSGNIINTCQVPAPAPSKICPDASYCVYGNGSSANCYANGEPRSNQNGQPIQCIGRIGSTDTAIWCPIGYTYDVLNSVCKYAGAVACSGCTQAFNITKNNTAYWNNPNCFSIQSGKKTKACVPLRLWPEPLAEFANISVLYIPPAHNDTNESSGSPSNNPLTINCAVSKTGTSGAVYNAIIDGGISPYTYKWLSNNNVLQEGPNSTLSLYSISMIVTVYVKDGQNQYAVKECPRAYQ